MQAFIILSLMFEINLNEKKNPFDTNDMHFYNNSKIQERFKHL